MFLLYVTSASNDDFLVNLPLLSQYSSSLLLAIVVRRNSELIDIDTLVKFAFIAIIVQSVIGIIQQVSLSNFGNPKAYFGEEIADELKGIFGVQLSRVVGTLGYPNLVANWINALLPFVIVAGLYHIKGRWKKNIWLYKRIVLIFGIIGILLTFSRGNILLLVLLSLISATVYYAQHVKDKLCSRAVDVGLRVRQLIFLIIIAGIISVVVVKNWDRLKIFTNVNVMKMAQLISGSYSDYSMNYRVEMNKGALQSFAKHPLLGIGFSNSKYIWPDVDTRIPLSWEYRPHNVFLVFAVEGGIIALVLYMFIVFYPLGLLIMQYGKRNPVTYAYSLSLIMCLGFTQIYLCPLQGEFAPLYMLISGSAMGYLDSIKK
jgi:O-antigen ligase